MPGELFVGLHGDGGTVGLLCVLGLAGLGQGHTGKDLRLVVAAVLAQRRLPTTPIHPIA
jgi:hypothetical protein